MRYALILAVFVVGCSGSPTAPSAPPSNPAATTPPITTPIATVPPVVVPPVVTPNPLLSDPRFDRAFYLQFRHGALDYPGAQLPAFGRWTRPPQIYLRIVDNAGAPVSAGLIEQTAVAIINTTSQWTGGAFGVAGLERGLSTRSGQAGWITVAWVTSGPCGSADAVGYEGATITMNHARPECTCGPLVAKHELGHALGYLHTDGATDLMAATFQGVCDRPLSPREAFHAQVAYSLPAGSAAP